MLGGVECLGTGYDRYGCCNGCGSYTQLLLCLSSFFSMSTNTFSTSPIKSNIMSLLPPGAQLITSATSIVLITFFQSALSRANFASHVALIILASVWMRLQYSGTSSCG